VALPAGAGYLVAGMDGRLRLRPVFQAQTHDPAELALVVRNEDQLPAHRLRCDQRIERPDGLACTLQLRTHVGIRRGVARGEFDERKWPKEVLHQTHGFHRRRALGRSGTELGLADDADCHVRAAPREHAFQHGRSLLQLGRAAGCRRVGCASLCHAFRLAPSPVVECRLAPDGGPRLRCLPPDGGPSVRYLLVASDRRPGIR